jgi:hypothetical protein
MFMMNSPTARQMSRTCRMRARVSKGEEERIGEFISVGKHTAFHSQCHGSAFLRRLGKFPGAISFQLVSLPSCQQETKVVSCDQQ